MCTYLPCPQLVQLLVFYFIVIVDSHHKSTPDSSQIPATVLGLLIRAISVNTGYTSRIVVRQKRC